VTPPRFSTTTQLQDAIPKRLGSEEWDPKLLRVTSVFPKSLFTTHSTHHVTKFLRDQGLKVRIFEYADHFLVIYPAETHQALDSSVPEVT